MKDSSKVYTFRCSFSEESADDKMMIEKMLHLRRITGFNNKQMLNLLVCIGTQAMGNCQNFSDFLSLFSLSLQNPASSSGAAKEIRPSRESALPETLPEAVPEDTPEKDPDQAEQAPSSAPASALDDLFQNKDDPETEKMIAEIFDL